MSAETMKGERLTHKAGMLLKNRAMEQAVWVIAIAKPSLKPAPGDMERELVGGSQPKNGPRKAERSKYVTWNQRLN
jgi:hypothetical protein